MEVQKNENGLLCFVFFSCETEDWTRNLDSKQYDCPALSYLLAGIVTSWTDMSRTEQVSSSSFSKHQAFCCQCQFWSESHSELWDAFDVCHIDDLSLGKGKWATYKMYNIRCIIKLCKNILGKGWEVFVFGDHGILDVKKEREADYLS